MRLIDADKLTKDLIENKSFYPAIVKRAIEEAPTVQVIGEWISVEERLPEEYGNVLCYSDDAFIGLYVYNPKYKLFNVSFDNVDCAIAVDYWMPLPQPPQMKGE
jgi:hypothetical protein